jgi:hypothetical protein
MTGSKDYCVECGRVIKEGQEHDYRAHGSTEEMARELAEWKLKLKQSGE